MTVQELLKKVGGLDQLTQRKIAVVIGAAVGDAAARPLHWVYDNSKLQTYIKDVPDTPEFLKESKSPFYTLPTGENSCYWDIAESSLGFIAAAKSSQLDYKGLCEKLNKDFSAGNSKGYDLDARQVYMGKRSRGEALTPIVGKWFHGAIIEFFKTYKNGSGTKPYGGRLIKETDGFCFNLPLVCKFLDDENLNTYSMDAIKTLSTYEIAVQHGMVASKLIAKLLKDPEFDIMSMGKEIGPEYPKVVNSFVGIHLVNEEKMDHTKAVNQVFGSPCYNPGSFQGAIHAVVNSGSYAEAIRKTIRAGGCNCSRALFAGAMCGAKYGLEGIPVDWIEKTTHAESIIQMAMEAYSS